MSHLTQLGGDDDDASSPSDDDVDWVIIVSAVAGLVVIVSCVCCVLYRRKGKDERADQMRRNLGYTPDMATKGEGNFGPTNTHVAITRAGESQPTPNVRPTKAFQATTYPTHQRAPSEAPSSIIENNIANNYRPRQAQQVNPVDHGIPWDAYPAVSVSVGEMEDAARTRTSFVGNPIKVGVSSVL